VGKGLLNQICSGAPNTA